MIKEIVTLLIVMTVVVPLPHSQNEQFEGVVTYSIKEFSGLGTPVEVPIDKQLVYFGADVILTKNVSGPFLLMAQPTDVCLDARSKVKWLIDHQNKIIKKIPPPDDIEIITPLEEIELDDMEINGYQCDVTQIKYVHRYMGPYGETADTLTCVYYNSKRYMLAKIKTFATLQGNRNTLFIDGRYEGLPLMVTYTKSDGSTTRIESTIVKHAKLNDEIKLPDYDLVSN